MLGASGSQHACVQIHTHITYRLGVCLCLPGLCIPQTPSQVKTLDTGQLTRGQLPSLPPRAPGLVKVTLGRAKEGGSGLGFRCLLAEGQHALVKRMHHRTQRPVQRRLVM